MKATSGNPIGSDVDGTEISIASQAAGDIMYYNGTAWVRLAKGTANQLLKMNVGATAPQWGAGGSIALISQSVLGSAGTTFDFTSLASSTDGVYFMVIELQNNTASNSDVSLYINNNTTETNYYTQETVSNDTTLSSSRGNYNSMSNMAASGKYLCTAWILISPDNYPLIQYRAVSSPGSGLQTKDGMISFTTAAEITQLTLVTTQNCAVGSRVSLYKLSRS